jgi:hypothetical protein
MNIVDEKVNIVDEEKYVSPTLSFSVKCESKLIPISDKKYRIKLIDLMKEKLFKEKSKLDSYFGNKLFDMYWKEFDPFKNERDIICMLANTYNVSNAWIKCYEILLYYDLINIKSNDSKELNKLSDKSTSDKSTDDYLHFDNAAFPGSFILATYHYAKTRCNLDYEWRASSLLESNGQTTNPVEDKYGLHFEYKENWLMHKECNGDVTKPCNIKEFRKTLGNKVNLYTSDLGFDVSSDYNNQELIHLQANIGQIISGLITLKIGGSFVTKQYTFFEPITISIIYAISTFFEEFYICKPYSSREANSEIYLVGKGFKNVNTGDIFSHPYIIAMIERMESKSTVPLFDAKDYPKEFLKHIVNACNTIYEKQIDKINKDIGRVDKAIKSGYRGHPSKNPVVLEFKKYEEKKLSDWYNTNYIKPIPKNKLLKMKDALGQKKLLGI